MLKLKLWNRWRNVFNIITTMSHALRSILINEGIEVSDVVWNAVHTRQPRPPLSSPPTVVFAGRLVREKGVDVLLRAFASVSQEIEDARLILAGDGCQAKYLEGLIGDLGISNRVTMTGYIPRSVLEGLFDAAWVQAVPSRCSEAFGLVAAEAMMRGTAVIASDAGGLVEIVGEDGQRGLLVPPGDEEALADALFSLLRNRQLAEKMGRAGREFALVHFNQESYIDNIIQLYDRICPGAS
jgi:glycosyltransferase involved in cell wall biosynthesis